MTTAVAQCVECDATFTDEDIEKSYKEGHKTCPKCNTGKPPRMLGVAREATELVAEYYAVKPFLTGRATPAMTPTDMTTRQQVGLWIVNFGRAEAMAKFREMPRQARRKYEKKWPGFKALLARICEP